MRTLRRAQQRYDDRRGKQAVWLTFYGQAAADPLANGFGRLQLLNEIHLPPGTAARPQAYDDTETITYVLAGALAYDDSLGCAGVTQAGEFRRMAATHNGRVSEVNASHAEWAHVFQIGLRSSGGLTGATEQKRFSSADRRDLLCLIAAADPSEGALRLREDAFVYSALLQTGQHLVHDLRVERRAWLHVISGQIALDDLVLTPGDGVGVTAERCVSFTAREAAEILLLDVA